MKTLLKIVSVAVIVLTVTSLSQGQFTYSFVNITGNSATNAGIGEDQFFMDVSEYNASEVLFRVYNTGPEASSITGVYFENSLLDGISGLIEDTTEVDFEAFASGGNLPGGNQPSVDFDEDFRADAVAQGEFLNGVPANGIGPDEELGVIVNLVGSTTYEDVIANLNAGDTRVGLHVQAFPDGGSEAFVSNGQVTVIPAPGAASLAFLGIFATKMLKRKKNQ